MSELPLSRAGKIATAIIDKINFAVGPDLPTCPTCVILRGQALDNEMPDNYVCHDCQQEWFNTPLGPVKLEEKPKWCSPTFPRLLFHPYTIACPKCVLEDKVLVIFEYKDDKEKSSFGKNFFLLKCPRCEYEKPRHEFEMGEHRHHLWFGHYLQSSWGITRRCALWDGMTMPLSMKPYKSSNRGHGRD